MASTPFLKASAFNLERDCLLCRKVCLKDKRRANVCNLGTCGWEKLKQYAKTWSGLAIGYDDEFHCFALVNDCIKDTDKENASGRAHKRCRRNFFDKKSSKGTDQRPPNNLLLVLLKYLSLQLLLKKPKFLQEARTLFH